MNRTWRFGLLALAVALLLAVLSPLASQHPDGLERVVEDNAPAVAEHQAQPAARSPLADYAIPGWGPAGTIVCGLLGTLGVFAAGFGLTRLLARRSAKADPTPGGQTP